MSQTVNVGKRIELLNEANFIKNLRGNFLEEKYTLEDHFTGVSLDTSKWATSLPGTGDTIAISEILGGCVLLTTGTVDDDSCMLAGAIIFNGTKKSVLHARIHIVDVSGTALFVGFSDAKSEANNSIAVHYAANALTTVATNAVGFVVDADHATSSVMCCGVAADVDDTAVDTGIDWADGETRDLRIILENGVALFFVDGVQKARLAAAVTTGTLLCATFQAMTRANDGANEVRVYKVKAWMDE